MKANELYYIREREKIIYVCEAIWNKEKKISN